MNDFETWFSELKALALAVGWDWDTKDPSPWENYHRDGYTPQDALDEEMSYND